MIDAFKFWLVKQVVDVGMVIVALVFILLVSFFQGMRSHWRQSRQRDNNDV